MHAVTLRPAVRGLLVVLGLGLLAFGGLWGLFPEPCLQVTGIAAEDALSRNMLKTDMGGGLLGTGLLFVLAGLRGGTWTTAALILVCCYLLVRSVSVVVDGPTPLALLGVAAEAAAVAVLMAARRLETTAPAP